MEIPSNEAILRDSDIADWSATDAKLSGLPNYTQLKRHLCAELDEKRDGNDDRHVY
jgi:hypothetical protein